MTVRARGPGGLLGALSTLAAVACSDDACEDRSFNPPPEPEPGADSPPTIVAGEWIGPGVLELQFSRPITSDGDLDPRRFVILGWDVQALDGSDSCYDLTSYRALSTSYYYYYNPQSPIAAVWIGPEDDTLLRLRLGNTASQCPTSANSLASGVMLAYTNGSETAGPELLSESGDPISDIGPAWAIQALDNYVDTGGSSILGRGYAGQLPNLDTLVDIPCP